jgi:hypothetical protein
MASFPSLITLAVVPAVGLFVLGVVLSRTPDVITGRTTRLVVASFLGFSVLGACALFTTRWPIVSVAFIVGAAVSVVVACVTMTRIAGELEKHRRP